MALLRRFLLEWEVPCYRIRKLFQTVTVEDVWLTVVAARPSPSWYLGPERVPSTVSRAAEIEATTLPWRFRW